MLGSGSIGKCSEQQNENLAISVPCRFMEGRHSILVFHIDVCLGVQHQFRHLCMTIQCCSRQGRLSSTIFRSYICPSVFSPMHSGSDVVTPLSYGNPKTQPHKG